MAADCDKKIEQLIDSLLVSSDYPVGKGPGDGF